MYLVFLALALLLLDIASKGVALHFIPPMRGAIYPFGGIPVFADVGGISFSLNLTFNTGAAWGFFPGTAGLLFLLRLGVIAGLLVYLFSRRSSLSLWLVAAGAVGNALDYLLYGHVVDFFHFVFWGYSFPIFNGADAMITLGVIGLFLFPPHKQQIVLL